MTPVPPLLCRAHRAPGRHLRAIAQGFTLVELMVVVAIAAIITAIALPSYTAYVTRSRVPAGLDALQTYFTRMEQRFQDAGSYAASGACAMSLPTDTDTYTFGCSVSGGGTGFTATATGRNRLSGYTYTINGEGTRATTAHPNGLPPSSCWTIGGGKCDM